MHTLNEIQSVHGFHNLKQFSDSIPKWQMQNKIVGGGTELAIFPSKLRENAINIIRHLKMNPPKREDFDASPELLYCCKSIYEVHKEEQRRFEFALGRNQGKIEVLMWLFNIIEDDLKEVI